MAPDSYADTSSAPADGPDEGADRADDPAEDQEENTCLVPKSLFGHDCQPGEKYTVEVVHSYEDELEVRASKDKAAQGVMDDA